jgi:hypothetical protein
MVVAVCGCLQKIDEARLVGEHRTLPGEDCGKISENSRKEENMALPWRHYRISLQLLLKPFSDGKYL